MKIHTVKSGETLSEIASQYGICEKDLAESNGIFGNKTAVGEELLIIVPTRVHTARTGDTIERICLRYRVRKNDLLALNPSLCRKKIEAGQRIALKYDERTHGMAVTNGYIYKGITNDALRHALPYMTYATFASVTADKRGLHKIFNEGVLLDTVKEAGKIPILKVHDSFTERFKSEEETSAFCDELIELARSLDYKGILLNSTSHSDSAEDYIQFLIILK